MAGDPDPWRVSEWAALLANPEGCCIAGCDSTEIDRRGPVFIRGGAMHKACPEHWEAIFGVIGRQQAWEQGDAMRWTP